MGQARPLRAICLTHICWVNPYKKVEEMTFKPDQSRLFEDTTIQGQASEDIMRKRKLRHDGQFAPGNIPWNKGGTRKAKARPPTYVRVTEEEIRLLADTDRKGNFIQNKKDIIREARRPIILRPKKSTSSEMAQYLQDDSEEGPDDVIGYRIWKATTAVRACAKAQREHDTQEPTCHELVRASALGEKKMGLATSETLVCDRCGYTSSSPQKFYNVMKRDGPGPRTPVINMAAQIALADSPMAVSAFREMMACMDLVVPSASCLQTLANKYSDIIEEENEIDMKRWREVVKKISELQGNEPGSPIRAQVDTRYQTQIGHLRGRKPGQPSPHSNAILAEEVTTRGKIIANYLRNKNCGMCKWWNAYGFEAPPHKCTANISEQAVIGDEEEAGRAMAKDLLESKLTLGGLITDGDSHTHRAVAEVMQEEAGVRTKPERCVVHVTRNVRGKVTSTKFSAGMFPGKTSIARDRVKSRFANDLVQRLNAEHGRAFEKIGMLRKCAMERAMDKAMQAIPSCYAGDHRYCYDYSLVCRHPSEWKFQMIPSRARGKICPTPSDCKLLRKCMEGRLGEAMLEKTRHGADTNRVEGVNRRISKSLPKNITRFRTLAGRIASALHSSNNGTGLSIAMKRLAAGIPLSPDSKAVVVLEEMRRTQDYKRAYNKEPGNKERTKANTLTKFGNYDETREQGSYKSEKVQEKGERESPIKRPKPDYTTDHVYSKPGGAEPRNDYSDSESDETDEDFSPS
ncbi:Hypp9464 [Branchiostoma lanceolatum]|uniref:Hypp9464 protein n=1 Tax=Branchiostoma lanceolatum TaxID=7740 RepID=A0A8S4MM92_BRALA|nr:Hypp9464 [Branchiostoma lanceolatum]